PERIAKFADDPFFHDKFKPADAYPSLADALDSDFDAVVIITQHWLHTPQALQALAAGKHVYSAVPLLTVPDGDEILECCDKLVETVARTGLHYMYGETTYYRPTAMYCRRRAAEGAFGDFVHAEGDYLHAFDSPGCDLREVIRSRRASAAGAEWVQKAKEYRRRGITTGPMHYPTHSTSGPICVMNAHMTRVCAWGYHNQTGEPYFRDDTDDPAGRFSNETALFRMSNNATCRIREYREVGYHGQEGFNVFGTEASFEGHVWHTKGQWSEVTVEEMRDPLPAEVLEAFAEAHGKDAYGGHGGSHAYLVNEFVDAIANDRTPAITAWDAVRYTAPGVMAHKSALRDGEMLDVPDWGDPPKAHR
ncbi:hypothetical protein LCGC14_2265870, partial [marine sediment metagenome]